MPRLPALSMPAIISLVTFVIVSAGHPAFYLRAPANDNSSEGRALPCITVRSAARCNLPVKDDISAVTNKFPTNLARGNSDRFGKSQWAKYCWSIEAAERKRTHSLFVPLARAAKNDRLALTGSNMGARWKGLHDINATSCIGSIPRDHPRDIPFSPRRRSAADIARKVARCALESQSISRDLSNNSD